MGKRKYAGISQVFNKWRVIVSVGGKQVHVGYFKTEQDALVARKRFMADIGRISSIVDLDGEVWKQSPLLGYPIFISNKGRVKSVDFNRMGFEHLYVFQRGWRGRYYTLVVREKRYLVHRLVADAFIGQSKLEVNHIDNNGFNNCVENLEYVTHRENISHGFGGALGATFVDGYWQCALKIDGRAKTLGYYKTKEEAHARYLKALSDLGEENRYTKI